MRTDFDADDDDEGDDVASVGMYETRTCYRTYQDHFYNERWWWGVAQRYMQQRHSFTGRYREET